MQTPAGLLAWLLFVIFIYQYSLYSGNGYHHLIYSVSHIVAIAFSVPMLIVLGMYWWEIKKDAESAEEVASFKRDIRKEMKKKRPEKRKKVS